MNRARTAVLFSLCLLAAPAFAQSIGGGTCAVPNLNGPYGLNLSGRSISAAGSLQGSLEGVGTMTFNGSGSVTATGTLNTNQTAGQKFNFAGTYTVAANCYVTINLTSGSTATFAAVVWSNGTQFNFTGSDTNYVYSGRGTSNQPACANSSLSGQYTFDSSGSTLLGTAQTGVGDEAGFLFFDGQGNIANAAYTITSSGGVSTALTATGTYAVTSNCLVTATLTDSSGKANALNFAIEGTYGQNLVILEANSNFIRLGGAHSAFLNPSQSIANVASYAINATPPGSVFALFGIGLAATGKSSQAMVTPLPTTLLSTKVFVNNEAAPLFYVDANQIDAQMPLDIPIGTVASVYVTNGTASSNAAAVFIPTTATPGLSVATPNRAVVVDATQNNVVNTSSTPSAVGDVMVGYFTGGGPVTPSGKLTTGGVSPPGQSPVTENYTVTVGGINANVAYVGLSAGSVGLYQYNFTVPQIAKGTYPVVLTIGGQASNSLGGVSPNPVMTVSN